MSGLLEAIDRLQVTPASLAQDSPKRLDFTTLSRPAGDNDQRIG